MILSRTQMLVSVLACLWVAACGGRTNEPLRESQRIPVSAEEAIYRLGSGDKVRVVVYNEENLSGEYEVDGSGVLALKLIGQVPARGKSLPDLTSDVENRLRQGYLRDPKVSIEVLNYRPFYVLGEVKEPGKYPYVNGMTVLNAIALAGGYTPRARENRLIIVRGGERNQREQLADESTIILPGDILRVPERFF